MTFQQRVLAFTCLLLLFVSVAIVLLVKAEQQHVGSLVRNTILLAAGTCGISLPAGTLLALLLFRTDLPGRRAAALLLAGMMFVPLYLQAAGWDAGFGDRGWFTSLAWSPEQPLLERTASRGLPAAIWIHAMAALPWVVLIVGLGLRTVRPELEEEALLDARPGLVFMRVTWNRTAVAAAIAALWIVVMTAGEMTVTDLYQVRTYAEVLYQTAQMDLQGAYAGASAGIAVVACLVLVALAATTLIAPVGRQSTLRPPHVFPLGRYRFFAAALVALILIVVVGVPLGSLCYKAGMDVQQIGVDRIRVWSVDKFAHTLVDTPRRFARDFAWTAAIGAVAATLTSAVAGWLAWRASDGGVRAWPALGISAICLGLPGPVIGLVLIWLLNREQSSVLVWLYDRTILAPVLAMMIRGLPVVTLVWWYSLRNIGADQLDSAATEGAGAWTRFSRIAVPQRRAAVAIAWLLAFAIATGDLVASILVVPPRVDLVSVRVFTLLHAGVDEQVAGICLVTFIGYIAVGGACLCVSRFVRRGTAPFKQTQLK